MKKLESTLEYKLEIDRVLGFYRRSEKFPEIEMSYNQYVNLIILDSDLDHYEKSELLNYWREKTEK